MSENTILDLNSMMNESLDTIPEAPDYSNPPAGEYTLEVKDAIVESYKAKAKGDMPAHDAQRLKITYAVAATHSTADGEQPVPDGTLFTETFQGTEQGLSFFKKRIREVLNVSDVAGVTLGDMMASAKGVTFDARLSIKKSPKPGVANEFYENLVIRVVQQKA